MAPGVFCVWSRADPDADRPPNPDDGDECLFTDRIASLQGVSRGVRLEVSDQQSVEPPFTHDVPFLSMYELPDVAYCQEKEFKDSEEQCAFKECDGFAPRVYEEIERIEAEEFKGVIGELLAVVTGEGFPEGGEEDFWTFHREEFVGSFMQAPEFIRAQVFKMVGDVGPEIKKEVPTGPYMFVYHWDCLEVPWSEVIAAAQTKGYIKHIEGGIKWQGLNYHPYRFTEKPVERGCEDAELEENDEDEGEEVDTEADEEDSETEAVNGVENGNTKDVIEPEKVAAKEFNAQDEKRAANADKKEEDHAASSNRSEAKGMSRIEDEGMEKPKVGNGVPTVVANGTTSTKLSGALDTLSIRDTKRQMEGPNPSKGVNVGETESPEIFASVSVADKIKAWEKNAAS
ncbi:hypothetical protein K458DRAFT_388600 [Lentithecium fluviatile CBS 122367]|uniref:Uncharacterized protein n=1 Tax=Lentithecium fluviatile CBS 122367 TaxID=1168545 RepID=A0A6G1J315_9PLEO|nr:hypothetical protein K458DRAFT_388600 [Lentithecium fluviatile CBS 122367]